MRMPDCLGAPKRCSRSLTDRVDMAECPSRPRHYGQAPRSGLLTGGARRQPLGLAVAGAAACNPGWIEYLAVRIKTER